MKLFPRPTSISCYQGQADALSAALKQHHGMAMPKTGQATGRAGARAIWAGPSVFWWVQNRMQICQTTPQSWIKATVGAF